MDKRSLLAVALSVAVLAIWQVLFAPKPRPRPPVAPPQQEAVTTQPESAPPERSGATTPPTEAGTPMEGASSPASIGAMKRDEFIAETDTYSVRFSNEGGRILSWRLLKYVDELKAPLELVPRETATLEEYPLRLVLPGDEATTRILDRALYTEEIHDSKPEDAWPGGGFSGRAVTFTWADGRGLSVLKRLAISRSGYVNHVEVDVRRNG